ncbi:hypothetical protein KI387_023348, partial [Taxus chinensis]
LRRIQMHSFDFPSRMAAKFDRVVTLESSPAILSLILSATVGIILVLFFRYKHKSSVKLPPGKLGFPLIGETIPFLQSLRSDTPQKFIDEKVKKFGPVFKTSLVGHPTVVFCGPAGNRLILSNENKLVHIAWPNSFMKVIGQDSLLSKTGEEHRIVRSALSNFLRPQALQIYMAKMSTEIQSHINEKWKGKDEVKMLPLVSDLVLSIATSLFFGINDEHQREVIHNLLDIISVGQVAVPLDIPGTRYRKALEARSELDKILWFN